MKVLESGRILVSDEEQRMYVDAGAYLARRCGAAIDTATPVTVEELLFLELAREALVGDFARVDRIIAEIEAMVAARLQPH